MYVMLHILNNGIYISREEIYYDELILERYVESIDDESECNKK